MQYKYHVLSVLLRHCHTGSHAVVLNISTIRFQDKSKTLSVILFINHVHLY